MLQNPCVRVSCNVDWLLDLGAFGGSLRRMSEIARRYRNGVTKAIRVKHLTAEQAAARGLTQKQALFCWYFVNGEHGVRGNGSRSGIAAKYSSKCAAQRAAEVLNKPEALAYIRELEQRHMAAEGVFGNATIRYLAEHARSDAVKLDAAKALRDGAGLKAAERINIQVAHSGAELERELAELLGLSPDERRTPCVIDSNTGELIDS